MAANDNHHVPDRERFVADRLVIARDHQPVTIGRALSGKYHVELCHDCEETIDA